MKKSLGTIGQKILFTSVLLLVIAILTTGAILSRLYTSESIFQAGYYSTSLVEQIAANLNTRTKEYEDGILSMVQGWRLFEDYFNNSDSLPYYNRRNLASFVNTRNTTQSPIEEIYVLDRYGQITEFCYSTQRFEGKSPAVREKLLETGDDFPWGCEWFVTEDSPDIVYMARRIIHARTLQPQGSIVVGIQKQIFSSQFSTLQEGGYGSLLVASEQGQLIFGSTEEPVEIAELLSVPREQYTESSLLKFQNGKFLFRRHNSRDGKWAVLYFISEHALSQKMSQTIALIFLVCAAFIVISGVCMSGIAHNLTQGIQRLIKHLKLVRHGGWEPIGPPYPNDEVGEITLAYNEMVRDLHMLVEEVSEQKMLAERAQFRALQAEFKELQAMLNPHFIYNAMEAMNARAKLAGQQEISRICIALAKLMRASLSRKSNIITMEEEISHLQNYLEIQQFIMGDRLDAFFELCDGLDRVRIPALLLQPIVENAIVHGVEGQEGDAVIFISVSFETYHDQECVAVRISDNGAGMDAETLNQLRSLTPKSEDPPGHFGLISVMRRIWIYYGEAYGLQIESTQGQGTNITVHLPVHKEGEDPFEIRRICG